MSVYSHVQYGAWHPTKPEGRIVATANLRSAAEGTELELHITAAEAARIAAGDTTFSAGEDLDAGSDVVEIRVYVSDAPAPATPIDGT